MSSSRIFVIDTLRALAVVLMIFIHATAYFLHDKVIYVLWDVTHIVVPLFVFCSAYLTFDANKTISFSLSYIWSRVRRIMVPYYVYCAGFITLSTLTNPQRLSPDAIASLLLLGSARDVGWLVVLFLCIMLIAPVLRVLHDTHRVAWGSVILAGIAASAYLLLWQIPFPFRAVMWLPWIAFLGFTHLMATYVQTVKRRVVFLAILAIVAVFTWVLRDHAGLSQVLTENKYPPNLWYLSYGAFWITLLILLLTRFEKILTSLPVFASAISFLSRHSYAIFFIHFLILQGILDAGAHRTLGPWGLTAILLVGSVGAMGGWGLVKRLTFARR